MTDKEINSKLKNDDKSVLRYLFDHYQLLLYRYALKLTLNKEASEEIVQDIFISIWQKRSERNIDNFKHYLLKAVKFRSINYIKAQARWSDKTDESIAYNNTDGITPVQEMEGRELSEAIEKAIQQLPKKCAAIFTLSRNSELSYKEIAAELNISVKTVENQIGIALKKLREMLKNYVNV